MIKILDQEKKIFLELQSAEIKFTCIMDDKDDCEFYRLEVNDYFFNLVKLFNENVYAMSAIDNIFYAYLNDFFTTPDNRDIRINILSIKTKINIQLQDLTLKPGKDFTLL